MSDLSGQVDLFSATEGTALASNTDVASFTDANSSDTAANFTATIDWGDGVTTTNAVVVGGTGGPFTVEGGHTYADDEAVFPVVTVNRTTDNTQLVMQSFGFAPNDADNLVSQGAPVATGSSNVALTNQVVATFSDTYFGNGIADFNASIDWGDGTTTAGTLSLGGNNIYTITGTHTYTADGQYTVTTFMNDDGGNAFGFAQTQADIGFGATATFTAAQETVAVPAGTQVATFSDNTGDPATDYTATIAWGDGTTDVGTVTGSSGSFTVSNTVGHTYADEGLYTETVTINRAADGVVPAGTATATGTVTVFEADAFENGVGTTLTGSPGVSTGTVTLATFNDTNTVNGAGDFVATVDWGDGTTDVGTVTGSGGAFTVSDSHTYAQNGTFTVTVGVADGTEAQEDGQSTASIVVQDTAFIGIAPVSGANISGTEGVPIPAGTKTATFSDSDTTEPATNFTATVDWGNGTTTNGTVSGSNGSFTVTAGPNTYADEDHEVVTTTVTDTVTHTSITMTGNATLADADSLVVTADNFSGSAGSANNVQVATFTDTYLANVAGDFFTEIAWGDGTTTAGTVSGSNGSFTVDGSHAYAAAGTDTFTVKVADDGFGTASASGSGTATIVARNLAGTMVLNSATEATALPPTTTVATFTDSDTSDMAGDFSASIVWGDGATTAGTVVGGSGSFTVEGGHTYADEGSDPASVIFTHTADSLSATASGNVAVAEADALTGQGAPIMTTQGQAFSGTVATFTDTDTANVAGDFAATISWGDGTTTAGTVSGGSGAFAVSGSHTYTSAGFDTVKVTLADDAPGTATATATSTATVMLPGVEVLHAATEGKMLPNNTPVATFTDNNPADHANSFTASINWGDGVTTAGTVVGSGGTFTVEGGHRYLDEGNDTATVTLTRTSDHLQSTASGSVAVAEGDVLSPLGRIGLALPTFSGTIASFDDDGNLFNVPGDFTATIDWGDGTTTTGTVTVAGDGDDFSVQGTHTYAATGIDVVKVKLTDDAPGTATATATSLVLAVVPGGHHALAAEATSNVAAAASSDNTTTGLLSQIESFSGANLAPTAGTTMPDGSVVKATANFDHGNNSDLVSQASDGTPEIWMMNGTSTTGTVTLANPGTSWNVIGTGDFNGDGNTDILFQNSDGTPGIWEMNGTSVISMTGLSNPGSSWHAIGAGDFNGDGNADILFQNDDGTPMIWQMNGTTVISQTTLSNPGSQWHAVATGDFFGDGHTDILWQSTDGTPGIWEMNGTSIVAEGSLPNPGTSWQVIGTGDFTGDGKAGILWQASDGTIGVWTMDGMTPTTMAAVGNVSPTTNASAAQAPSVQPATTRLSTPDMAGLAGTQSASAGPFVLGGSGQQQNLLQPFTAGAGLHLT